MSLLKDLLRPQNKAPLRILTSKDPLKSVESEIQTLQLEFYIVHSVAYILGSFSQSQCGWLAITKEGFSVFMSIKKWSFYLQNAELLICSDHKPLFKIFTGHTNSDKCDTWGLEATAIPRHVKVQHIKVKAHVLADSMSRLRAVGLYHDFNFKNCTQEFSVP